MSQDAKKEDARKYQRLVNRFVNLANNMRAEGNEVPQITSAFMTACGIYTTYAAAGNQGGLNDSGVQKMAQLFELRLREVQSMKKAGLIQDDEQANTQG
jgi:hypothetical protein